nr:MAG TPA: hypothetical protein [Caudoviricetes sp.]
MIIHQSWYLLQCPHPCHFTNNQINNIASNASPIAPPIRNSNIVSLMILCHFVLGPLLFMLVHLTFFSVPQISCFLIKFLCTDVVINPAKLTSDLFYIRHLFASSGCNTDRQPSGNDADPDPTFTFSVDLRYHRYWNASFYEIGHLLTSFF